VAKLDIRSALIGFLVAACLALLLWHAGPGIDQAAAQVPSAAGQMAAQMQTTAAGPPGAQLVPPTQATIIQDTTYCGRWQIAPTPTGCYVLDNATGQISLITNGRGRVLGNVNDIR